jgi:thioredoxin-related protein
MKFFTALSIVLALAAPVCAAEMGEDGLYKPDWLRTTFKDMREDLGEAQAEGRRLVVIYEQRGCIYCERMHEEVFPLPQIDELIREKFFIVQMNLYGDEEVTDFDGTVLSEKDMAKRWGVFFTPTMIFLPDEVPEGQGAAQAAVAIMPGAFEEDTVRHLMNWVVEERYEQGEEFQRYHADMLEQEGAAGD